MPYLCCPALYYCLHAVSLLHHSLTNNVIYQKKKKPKNIKLKRDAIIHYIWISKKYIKKTKTSLLKKVRGKKTMNSSSKRKEKLAEIRTTINFY